MSKNGAGFDPDIEDVPGDFGYDEDPAFTPMSEVEADDLRDNEPDFQDEEGGFVPEEDIIG